MKKILISVCALWGILFGLQVGAMQEHPLVEVKSVALTAEMQEQLSAELVSMEAEGTLPELIDLEGNQVDIYAEDMSWNQPICDFTNKELEAVELAYRLFSTHAEEKVAKRLFADAGYRELVMAMTDELVVRLENTIKLCGPEGNELYALNWFYDIDVLEEEIMGYALMLQHLRVFAKQQDMLDGSVEQHIRNLQEIIMGDSFTYLRNNSFMEETSVMHFAGTFASNDGSADMALSVEANSAGDARGTIAQVELGLDLDMEVTEAEKAAVSVDASADLALRIIEGDIYVKLDNMELDVVGEEIDDLTQKEIDEMRTSLQLVEGKWLDILGGNDLGGMSPLPTMLLVDQQEGLMRGLFATDLLVSYGEENDIYNIGFNPLVCMHIGGIEGVDVQDCLAMRQEQYTATQGKGFLLLKERKDTVGLSFNPDVFVQLGLTQFGEAAEWENMIVWDESSLRKVRLPFGEMGELYFYQDKLTLDLSIPTTQYDRDTGESTVEYVTVSLQGKKQREGFMLEGDVVFAGGVATFDLDKVGGFGDMTLDMEFAFESAEGEDPMSFGVEMDVATTQEVVASVDVERPADDDIVDLASVMQ